jgi:hypothetical protein
MKILHWLHQIVNVKRIRLTECSYAMQKGIVLQFYADLT